MTAPDDVRACPFCGHLGPFDQWPCEWLDGSGANVIRCPMCHGAAPAKTWNRRAAHAGLSGEVRELVEALKEARRVIGLDRQSLFDCHRDPKTNTVTDAPGLAGLKEYDDALAMLDAALAKLTQEKP